MIRLAKPHIPPASFNLIKKILKSGNLIQGKYVEQFEKNIAKYLGCKYAVVVSSGTAALHLSLLTLDIKPGDEVIVPAFSFPATANVVELIGAKCKFVDITLEDFCINVSKIEQNITKKTKAIIVVHEFGQPANIESITKIAKKHKIFVIEDGACALGAEFKNKKVGTFGIMGCFSFHPRKTITTGEGGAIVTNDAILSEKLRALRNHGIVYRNKIQEFIYAGLNYRMTDFQAAIGLTQLSSLPALIEKNLKSAKFYNSRLSSLRGITVPANFPGRKMIYQTYHTLIKPTIRRDDLIKVLKTKGIETNLGAQCIPSLDYYQRKYRLKKENFINSYTAWRHGLALPIGRHIKNSDLRLIISSLTEILKSKPSEK